MEDDGCFVIVEEGDPLKGIKKSKEELEAEREAMREQGIDFNG